MYKIVVLEVIRTHHVKKKNISFENLKKIAVIAGSGVKGLQVNKVSPVESQRNSSISNFSKKSVKTS